MSPKRRPALLVLALALAACQQPSAQPPTPVTGGEGLWSNPATWGGKVPDANAAVTIPQGKTITLDTDASVRNLTVEGTLRFADKDVSLTTRWIMIHGGLLEVGTEAKPFAKKATLTLTGTDEAENVMGSGRMAMGTKLIGVMMGGRLELHGHRKDALSFTQLSAHAKPGDTSLTLKEAVNWRVGDQIVVAASGYDATQAEKLTLTAVDGNRVSFTPALKYRHFGQTQTYEGRVLDSRAHVGLLTRDIVIRGGPDSDASQFGGHVMVMPGSSARVAGVEFFRMGQMGIKGRYPLHWHLVDRNATGGVAGAGQYARNNSFHDSFQRAINLHGTNGVLLEGNVAYNVRNHAFVAAESGDEENNVLRGNLAVLVRSPARDQEAFKATSPAAVPDDQSLQNEQKSSAFWTRNTNNVFENNVAAGSVDGNGFFFDGQLQVDPSVPASDPSQRDYHEILDITVQKPARTVTFTGNIAYGHCPWDDEGRPGFAPPSFYQGVTTGHGLLVQEAAEVMRRQPNPTTDLVFSNFTAYKNCDSGVWLETGREVLRNSILADNNAAFIPEKGPRVENLLAIGKSANDVGSELEAADFRQLGLVWNDAIEPSFRLEGATFVNVKGAIVFTDDFAVGGGTVRGVKLVNSLPLAASADLRGSSAGFLLDADGSLTGTGRATRISINTLGAQSTPLQAPAFDGSNTLNYWATPQ